MTPAAFLHLVATGTVDEVRQALATHPDLINANAPHPFWGGQPQPLHIAIENRRDDIFTLLLDSGADPAGRNELYDHWSPLMLALQRGRPDYAKGLLERGAPVHLAEALLAGDDEATVANLGAIAPAPNEGSWLNFARTPRAIDLLLAAGCAAEIHDKWGQAPADALIALGPSGVPLLEYLAAKVPGLQLSSAQYARLGDLPSLRLASASQLQDPAVLHAAVEGRHCHLIRWLIAEQSVDPNIRRKAKSQQTPLHEASWNGDLETVETLLSLGADRTLTDLEHNATPLEWAETAIRFTGNHACEAVVSRLKR